MLNFTSSANVDKCVRLGELPHQMSRPSECAGCLHQEYSSPRLPPTSRVHAGYPHTVSCLLLHTLFLVLCRRLCCPSPVGLCRDSEIRFPAGPALPWLKGIIPMYPILSAAYVASRFCGGTLLLAVRLLVVMWPVTACLHPQSRGKEKIRTECPSRLTMV